ncbi:uncharacterized protein LOC113470249 [Diaphorina citri]|uniref:Uncharacterized protein LOC113470249 n=1 Tax=Diaphorina citri TaxID=121845 RepID=A0A3Q0J793_DIACI|nr:uncharacterized protein LOC113470249 [Diaphorina citri]
MNRSKLLSERHSEINKQIENVSKNEETKTRCEENPGDVDHQLTEKEATTQMKDSQITTPFNIDSADDNPTCTLSTEYFNGNDALVKSNLTMDNNNDKAIAKEEQPPLFDYFTTSNETCKGKESEKNSSTNTVSDFDSINSNDSLKDKHDCMKVVNILTSKLNPEELEAMKGSSYYVFQHV